MAKDTFRLVTWMPPDTKFTKRQLAEIINAQAHELSAIMGLLDGYEITRGNLSMPGHYGLSPYGRVCAAMALLHKCSAVSDYKSDSDEPDAYQAVLFSALLNKQAAEAAEEERDGSRNL
jgi:hypothetical protein